MASSFRNLESVKYVANHLKSKGYSQTYDWTQNAKGKENQTFTLEELGNIGQKEKEGVLEADFIVIILPGGKGTHIEFGLALGRGKKIFLYSPNEEVNNFETISTFYHLEEVEKCFGTLDELLEQVTTAKVS